MGNRNVKRVLFLLLGLAIGAGLAMLPGCQLDASAAIGAKSFYPDHAGDAKVGDPRKPMYEGSGYGERHTAGGESGMTGFSGMNGGESQ